MPGSACSTSTSSAGSTTRSRWPHAFGLGHLAEPMPFTETDAVRMWRATGRSGSPCQGCNLLWGYMGFVGGDDPGRGPEPQPGQRRAGRPRPASRTAATGSAPSASSSDPTTTRRCPTPARSTGARRAPRASTARPARTSRRTTPAATGSASGARGSTRSPCSPYVIAGSAPCCGPAAGSALVRPRVRGRAPAVVRAVPLGPARHRQLRPRHPPRRLRRRLRVRSPLRPARDGAHPRHRANRIINFAQAQLGAVPAVLALLLVSLKGWSYFAGDPDRRARSARAARGRRRPRRRQPLPHRAAAHPHRRDDRRRVRARSSPSSLTKQALTDDLSARPRSRSRRRGSDFTLQLGNYTLHRRPHRRRRRRRRLSPPALGALLRWTDIGIAIRASAENGERASMLGIPVARVSMVVWAIAAVALGARRLPAGAARRAAAVGLRRTRPAAARPGDRGARPAWSRCPKALLAGMLIGAIDRSVLFATQRPSLAQATMLGVILVALLVQRGRTGRAPRHR